MTAEVSVMNRMGIALAADSAVTIGPGAKKVYTSADKLFQLSLSHPVAIMVYGNANFLGIPWEIIVKVYRKKLGDTEFDTLEEYAQDFISFISDNRELFSEDRQNDYISILIRSLFYQILDYVAKKLDEEAEMRNGLNEEDVSNIFSCATKDYLRHIKKQDFLSGFTYETHEELRKKYTNTFSKLKKAVFGDLPSTPGTNRTLTNIALEMLCRDYFCTTESGIVIAGFGERDYMPVLISFELEEMVINKPRLIQRHKARIEDQNDASIIPFAQKDMVYSFMEGIDYELSEFIEVTTKKLFLDTIQTIIDFIKKSDEPLGSNLNKVLQPTIQTAVDKLFDEWKRRCIGYWEPVLQAVASLPKDELGIMAENLVNLTKFRRRVTTVQETVGGPVDVAVITKGDGFVWMRRKHYFDPSLNPRVIERYKKEV